MAVADLDGPAAEAVAAGLGAPALGAGCDVADEAALRALIERTETELGPVGVFFANAGVMGGTDEQTPEAMWDRAFSVNVRAHVVAARLLVPGWLERGAGCFVVTASAAGLLTQIGVAPYAVTKHAAVAFAEWLSVTYGDRGIHVSCICPMGVDTPMIRLPPEAAGRSAGLEAVGRRARSSRLQVAEVMVAGARGGALLILPHPEVLEFFRRKASDYDRWLAGMRRLRRAAESPA